MAIKERKQITGTTAQIRAYAGHNGVLAYATDTKHLHVLSGTAGTTTELANRADIPNVSGKADKTYVDTQLGTKATKAELTNGLAGKANSSHTHTSADVTDLNVTISNALKPYATMDTVNTELAKKANAIHTHTMSDIKYMPNFVFKVNNIAPDSDGNVNLGLHAVATSGDYNDLINKPSIPSTPLAYITEIWKSPDGSSRYHKWSDGYIEQWGLLNGSGGGGTVTFPKQFSNTKYIFVVTPNEEGTTGQWFEWSTYNKTTSSIDSAIVGGAGNGAPNQSWYAAGF